MSDYILQYVKEKCCPRCHKIKPLAEFHNCSRNLNGKRNECKKCSTLSNRNYMLKNHHKMKGYSRTWWLAHPWCHCLGGIWSRCNDPKCPTFNRYGGRGIITTLTAYDLKILWFRDHAYRMKHPSIDRINNDGNYELSNCRFIELRDNIRRKKCAKMF